ncbi:MAG: Autoinducer 2 import system permease protein LsrC [Actinobacteria bacterium ADurb.Bin444]|nr:MAG: Autoinducer 2 import system permease protein LsrC [Actinobacteria bacterium ADurb.Bin444]
MGTASTSKRLSLLIPGLIAGAAVLILLPHLMSTDYTRQLLNQALIYIVIVVGYNFFTGDIGQLSMAQQGFFAIGAYTTAILTTTSGWPWWAALLASMLITGFAGILVGIPTLKVRGQYLIMVTMGFSEIIRLVATNWGGLTNGASGIPKIPSPSLGAWHFTSKTSIYYLFLAMALIMILIAWRVRKTKYGRAFLAIRDGELAADVMGLNTTYVKVIAFFLSAVFAGMGGNMFASSFNYISPDTFTLSQTVLILAMLLIGGEGSISGAIVGAIILTYLPELLRFAANYYVMIYGLLILLITLFLPGGVVGYVKTLWKRTVGPKLFKTTPVAEAPREFNARDLLMGRSKAYQKPAPSSTESPSFEDGQPSLAKTVKKEGDAS